MVGPSAIFGRLCDQVGGTGDPQHARGWASLVDAGVIDSVLMEGTMSRLAPTCRVRDGSAVDRGPAERCPGGFGSRHRAVVASGTLVDGERVSG